MQCEVCGIEVFPLRREITGRKSTEYSSSGAVYLCALLCHLSPILQVLGVLIVTALGPTITMDMLVIGSSISQALFSPGN